MTHYFSSRNINSRAIHVGVDHVYVKIASNLLGSI